jgi:hypothetical protein
MERRTMKHLAYLHNPQPGGRDTLVQVVQFNHIEQVYGVVPVGSDPATTPRKFVRSALKWITPPSYMEHVWDTAHIINRALDYFVHTGSRQEAVEYMVTGREPSPNWRESYTERDWHRAHSVHKVVTEHPENGFTAQQTAAWILGTSGDGRNPR